MSVQKSLSRVRPLLVRPGARFVCVGDGLCCTDLHAVGPLRREERRMFRAMHPDLVIRFAGHDLLQAGDGGSCPFLEAEGCALHLRLGAAAKPRVCTRFPFGLTATPLGGRVTTSLRCSCRTLGERPEISPELAEQALTFPSGRMSADQRVADSIELEPGKWVEFSVYAAQEADLLRDLGSAPTVLEVVRKRLGRRRTGAARTPAELRERGEALASASLDTRFGAAVAWLGHALQIRGGARPSAWPERPWSAQFDRAEARTPAPSGARASAHAAQEVLGDYAAESLWTLDWVGRRTLREELWYIHDQLELLEILLEGLVGLGARPDRAAAEAVMVIDLAQPEDD